MPSKTITIHEDLLYFVWKTKLFDLRELVGTRGEKIRILEWGHQNHDSGPDFSEAKIEIDGTLWIGNVEMHIRASDWRRHGHQNDLAYSNTILHVVLEDDEEILLDGQARLVCLELNDRISKRVKEKYKSLQVAQDWIPCAGQVCTVQSLVVKYWLARVGTDRLAAKTSNLAETLQSVGSDWEEAFYRVLLQNFGFKVNATPCQLLAEGLPRSLLMKHKNSLVQIEALLFGQAGLLPAEGTDPYVVKLIQEYQHLKNKYQLSPIPTQSWKFMRLRPANFPTVRLAQFAVLFFRTNHLFSKMLAAQSIKELTEMFGSDVSAYWKTHYRFDSESTKKQKRLGKDAIRLLIINTVVPFVFYYGRYHDHQEHCDRAIRLLEDLPPENNGIIRKFKDLGVESDNALESQALLQLKKSYCDMRKCLSCAIGSSLLAG